MKQGLLLLGLIMVPFLANATVMNNTSIDDGCVYSNVGVYDGTATMIPQYTINSYTCDVGFYLPANGIYCVPGPHNTERCSGGTFTFNPSVDQGLGGTGIYDCDTGYYLPLGQTTCVLCPTNKYCSGGSYSFSATYDQGITDRVPIATMNNTTTNNGCDYHHLNAFSGTITMVPTYTINNYDCVAGTYLPADGLECVACLPGATCAGGIYAYNPTQDQGMVCDGTMYNNACHALCSVGNAIFHAGEYTYPIFADKINIPSPVLHVKYLDNTMCYGYLKTDAGGEHGLKVNWNGTTYHIIDPR